LQGGNNTVKLYLLVIQRKSGKHFSMRVLVSLRHRVLMAGVMW
jgi:hypothetical protein